MNSKRVLIVTEANEKVASGHLFESIECINYMREQGTDVTLMINDDMSDELKDRITGSFITYKTNIQEEALYLIDHIKENGYQQIVFNLRQIENDFLIKLRHSVESELICIDEFGHRELDCDVIINPMIDDNYWHYESNATLYCGQQYLVLPRKLEEYRDKEKRITEKIGTITVSMGGCDIGGSTIHLAKWLPFLNKECQINLVLGGGYGDESLLRDVVGDNPNIKIYRNIDYLSRLFYESDLAVCAGGNTLHELAVLGIPTIVVPSMPHEVDNGKAYERKGFALCGKMGGEITVEDFSLLYKQIEPQKVRNQMHERGRKLNDGKGYKRIYNIIMKNDEENI